MIVHRPSEKEGVGLPVFMTSLTPRPPYLPAQSHLGISLACHVRTATTMHCSWT